MVAIERLELSTLALSARCSDHARNHIEEERMVFILAASSLHYAIETLTPDEKAKFSLSRA